MPRIHTATKMQMMGRSFGRPWAFSRRWGWLVNTRFRVRWHAADVGEKLIDGTLTGVGGPNSVSDRRLRTLTDLAGTAYADAQFHAGGQAFEYAGYTNFVAPRWEVAIFPFTTSYDATNNGYSWATNTPYSTVYRAEGMPFAPATSDTDFYCMGIFDRPAAGNYSDCRWALYRAIRTMNGSPPDNAALWRLAAHAEPLGQPPIVLDEVTAVVKRRIDAADEGYPA